MTTDSSKYPPTKHGLNIRSCSFDTDDALRNHANVHDTVIALREAVEELYLHFQKDWKFICLGKPHRDRQIDRSPLVIRVANLD